MAKPTVKSTTDDLFNTLSQSVDTVAQKPKGKKKKDRPQIELSESEKKAFDTFCAADVVFKMAEGKQKAAKSLVLPILRHKLIKTWVEQGERTENPVVQTDKARANFVVREILKIDLPENDDGSSGSVKDRLMEIGFSKEEAKVIFEKDFTEKVEMNFRSLNELRKGTQEEQDTVKKLLSLVLKNFSTEEQRLLLRKETKVEVKEGFLNRAVEQADSVEKLDSLLNVISPQWVLSHMTYEGKDINGKDIKQAVADLTGGDLPESFEAKVEEFYSPDNQWKAVVRGGEAALYKCDESGDKLLGTKKCNGGPDHARMTCKKWLREDGYRAASIAEFVSKK